MDGVRRDDEFGALVVVHDARHAGREARIGRVGTLATRALVCETRIQDSEEFGFHRRLLPTSWWFGRVIAPAAAVAPHPLAFPVWVFGFVEGPGAAHHAD